jgi:hypothetical protein
MDIQLSSCVMLMDLSYLKWLVTLVC